MQARRRLTSWLRLACALVLSLGVSTAVAASVEETATGFRLHLSEPAYGVARGQAAVLYDGDVVVGSGLVTAASRV